MEKSDEIGFATMEKTMRERGKKLQQPEGES